MGNPGLTYSLPSARRLAPLGSKEHFPPEQFEVRRWRYLVRYWVRRASSVRSSCNQQMRQSRKKICRKGQTLHVWFSVGGKTHDRLFERLAFAPVEFWSFDFTQAVILATSNHASMSWITRPCSMSRRLRLGISSRRESNPIWCSTVACTSVTK